MVLAYLPTKLDDSCVFYVGKYSSTIEHLGFPPKNVADIPIEIRDMSSLYIPILVAWIHKKKSSVIFQPTGGQPNV